MPAESCNIHANPLKHEEGAGAGIKLMLITGWQLVAARSMLGWGDIELAKFLAKNGPSGWYSHRWISRADQSFSKQKPPR